eukprot:XP_011433199.1 PREDICTED: uncharacterized protein LOC105332340 [Crassostrea gigas]
MRLLNVYKIKVAMDPRISAQDVLRCRLCKTPIPPLYCDICHIHLCKTCAGEHILDESSEHKVVVFKKRGLAPSCSKHSKKLCELHCKQCDIPICLQCISFGEHHGHELVEISKILENKKKKLDRDLQELENSIFPKYQEIASIIPVQTNDLNQNFQKLASAISKRGEDMHKEIYIAMQKLIFEVNEMESKHLVVLEEQEDEIKRSISEITQIIADLKEILNSNNICLISDYKSRIAEFRRLPSKITVTLPSLTPHKIDNEQLQQRFGSLTGLSFTTEERYLPDSSDDESSLPDKQLIDKPLIITIINTEYGDLNRLCSVACQNDDEVWTRGQNNVIRLYNTTGNMLQSIKTKSGHKPWDISLTKRGELVYTAYSDNSVNKVTNTEIQTVIKLWEWRPRSVCSASSGDFLVICVSDDEKQTKVVRYSDTKEVQSIQFNDKGLPLYSSNFLPKYICENKNLDICVADNEARAVVVVSQAGKPRLIYNGSHMNTRDPFKPVGITTDSQSRILTADYNNDRIHILDKDGQFLCYFDNCDLQGPLGLCVNNRDNLFVAEYKTGKVKKIQYVI